MRGGGAASELYFHLPPPLIKRFKRGVEILARGDFVVDMDVDLVNCILTTFPATLDMKYI